jgi:hypothetical protein
VSFTYLQRCKHNKKNEKFKKKKGPKAKNHPKTASKFLDLYILGVYKGGKVILRWHPKISLG